MTDLIALALMLWIGLTAGNFVWQLFTDQRWKVAVERSWFQLVALALYLLTIRPR